MKKIYLLVFFCASVSLFSKDATEVQSIDGGQRNQITGGTGSIDANSNTSVFGNWNLYGPQNQIGTNSASVLIIPGSTITGANGLLYNGGVLWIPADLTGTASNGTSLVVMGNMSVSNVVSRASDGWTRFTAGAGATNMVIDGLGTIPLQTKSLVSQSTNSLNSAVFNINLNNTNNSQRSFVDIAILQPAASGTMLVTISPNLSVTNRSCPVYNLAAGSVTNHVSGWVSPNAFFYPSNVVGTPSVIQDLSVITGL